MIMMVTPVATGQRLKPSHFNLISFMCYGYVYLSIGLDNQ